MHHRTFQDRLGVVWRVTEVAPEDPGADETRERRDRPRRARPAPKDKRLTTRPHAWLYFESKSERRRVSSVPNRWQDLDEIELEDLLAHSRPV